MTKLQGRPAIVTGGAQGLGVAICLRRFGFSPYYRGLSKTKHSRN